MTEMVNVPREPTREMIEAVKHHWPLGYTENAKREDTVNLYRAMLAAAPKAEPISEPYKSETQWINHFRSQPEAPKGEQEPLTVWFGSMPESNGRENWTAVLHRKGATGFAIHDDGFCFARSEYPDRVRYEADEMRWLIGELQEKPDILDYDEKKHSGYAHPAPASDELLEALEWFCDRVDRGEVRSKSTYARFKALIAKHKGPQS